MKLIGFVLKIKIRQIDFYQFSTVDKMIWAQTEYLLQEVNVLM